MAGKWNNNVKIECYCQHNCLCVFHVILEYFAEKTTKTQANLVQSVQSLEEGKDQESIQSSTTPDPGRLMGK